MGLLLLQFYWYYSFQFDTRRKVISVRPVPLRDVEGCAAVGLPFPDSPYKDEKICNGSWTQKSFIRCVMC